MNAPWNHIKGAVKRALWDWTPIGTVDEAESDLDDILTGIIDKYVNFKTPKRHSPSPWWNAKCEKAYKWKLKTFANRLTDPVKYQAAIKFNRRIQKKAFKTHQQRIKDKLNNLSSNDSNFWQLAKEIGGLTTDRSQSTPSTQKLADHFADKMSNGKDIHDVKYTPPDSFRIPLSGLKIRFKAVLKMLKQMNPSKSANGVSPRFWKECADLLAPSVTKLYRYIVKKKKYVSRWKEGRISALHKRGSVKDPKNYRPLKVLINISVGFEKVVHPQLYKWISKFIPTSQFGFLKGVGSSEYGCTLLFKMMSVLERRGEGILISLDVKGAFDRVWWEMLVAKMEARGLEDDALELIKDYLCKRFLRVVSQASHSAKLEIFSGVPQGAVWSPDFWDFDIADIPTVISSEGDDFEYADDCGLWYEIDDDNRDVIVSIINIDLQSLVMWGQGNLTTFEPDKTTYTIISRKRDPFDPFERSAGIMMGGAQVKRVDEVKLVGFLFDTKLTFSSMIDKLAKKARCRLGALRRLKPMLDKSNLKQMYTMFIRSILEYGSLVYMGAAKSHLDKLDRVQESAMKLCGFEIESLESRREAAAIGLALDLLDGKGYGELQDHVSTLIEPLKLAKKRTRQNVDAGTQLKPKTKTSSLDSFKSSYLGSIHKIWSRLPQSLVREGLSSNWSKIKSRAKKFCIGKWSPAEKSTRPQRKKIKKNENYSSKLNNELNAHTDWDAIRKDLKDQGISINKIGHL